MTPAQLELRKNAELAVRAYGSAFGTEKEKELSDLADNCLRKYFNSFRKK